MQTHTVFIKKLKLIAPVHQKTWELQEKNYKQLPIIHGEKNGVEEVDTELKEHNRGLHQYLLIGFGVYVYRWKEQHTRFILM